METGHTELSNETKRIKALRYADSGSEIFIVGERGVTEIVAYDEHGEMEWVPWLAVYHGDKKLWMRVPAKNVAVYYE